MYVDRSLTFSHIDSCFAYGDSTGQIGIIDVSSGTQHSFVAHEGPISSLAYTSCGQLLLSGGKDCKSNEVNINILCILLRKWLRLMIMHETSK